MDRSDYSRSALQSALRRHWFPVARVQDLDRTQPALLLGEPLAVFRDSSGCLRVVSRRCIHRGGDLSAGLVVDAGIECPYHGWIFDGATGRCQLIPSAGPTGRVPDRARIKAYPVQERFGHVWTCLGTPVFDIPKVEDFTELDGLDLSWSTGVQFELECGFMAQAENFRDVAHFPFVHRRWTGSASAEVPRLEVHRDGRQVWAQCSFPYVEDAKFYDIGESTFHYRAFAPGIGALLIDFGPHGKRFLVNFACPTSLESCVVFWTVAVEKTFSIGSLERVVRLEQSIYREDAQVISSLTPKEVPLANEAEEVSCAADAYTLNFRRASRYVLDTIARAAAGQPGNDVPATSDAAPAKSAPKTA